MRVKSPNKENPKSQTLIDLRKSDLAAQELALHAEIARRQKLIADAPRLAEEASRRRRDELIHRKSRTEARYCSPGALPDRRFDANTAPTRSRSLRKHRNQGMATFFLLCAVLAGVLFMLYQKILHGG